MVRPVVEAKSGTSPAVFGACEIGVSGSKMVGARTIHSSGKTQVAPPTDTRAGLDTGNRLAVTGETPRSLGGVGGARSLRRSSSVGSMPSVLMAAHSWAAGPVKTMLSPLTSAATSCGHIAAHPAVLTAVRALSERQDRAVRERSNKLRRVVLGMRLRGAPSRSVGRLLRLLLREERRGRRPRRGGGGRRSRASLRAALV
eukprot:COSAG04_NODE_349_length_16104_cov_34.698032_2_plen_200_part_00